MLSPQNTLFQTISQLKDKSCLINILNEYGMGPKVYDIITPKSDVTEVYICSNKSRDLTAETDYLEKSLNNLLDFIEQNIKNNKLIFQHYKTENRRTSSPYNIKLSLSKQLQKRYENLSQGLILIPEYNPSN